MKKPIQQKARRPLAQRRPNVRDVARLAGVSMATVSRALSRPELVSHDRLIAVRAAVEKLNYVIQGVGRALVSRRTFMIGAIVPSFDHAMFSMTTFALQNTIGAKGYMLALANSDFNAAAEIPLVRHLIERGTDGIVLFGRRHEPELLAMLENFSIPYISTWAFDPGTRGTHIGFDNRKAATLIVDHLVSLGHRDIGIISGFRHSEWQQDRLHWIKAEFDRRGISMPAELFFDGPISYDTGRQGIRALLMGRRRPTAIICGHDIIAVGAIAMCHDLGIAIPGDVSLTGFENLDLASNVTPPLTTVQFPAGELGVRAGEEILKRIEGDASAGQIELPIRLLARGTSAALQGGALRSTSRARSKRSR